MLSKDQIREFSSRLAIDENTIIREYIQVVFLGVLYGAKASQKITFKGGTAIRLLLGSGRFSEDLDFTAELSSVELESLVSATLKKVVYTVPGLKLKKTDEGRQSYTGILSYQPDGMKYPLNIHLDFSRRETPETSIQSVLETDFPVIPQPIIRHMEWPEVLAEKIRAFLVRAKGRDVYDLWFMLDRGVKLDWGMINRKSAMYDNIVSLDDLIRRVGEFDEKQLKNDLGKFLPAHDRGFVEHLKMITVKQLRLRQAFTIIRSDSLDYSKQPGGSFSREENQRIDDLKKTQITALTRQDENTLKVILLNEYERERTGYIRARTRNGVRELDVIQAQSVQLIGKSYDALLSHVFGSEA